jgi:NADH:ubiquinone oxidoreductase subunit B-like Fe-S oxidoreductase
MFAYLRRISKGAPFYWAIPLLAFFIFSGCAAETVQAAVKDLQSKIRQRQKNHRAHRDEEN